MNKSKIAILFLAFGIGLSLWVAGYVFGRKQKIAEVTTIPDHQHQWGFWQAPIRGTTKNSEGFDPYIQLRQCTNCGWAETRSVHETQ